MELSLERQPACLPVRSVGYSTAVRQRAAFAIGATLGAALGFVGGATSRDLAASYTWQEVHLRVVN